jgi:8-oxo-dGTP diphosphatase
MMLTPETEKEIAELGERFGTPTRWRREYEIPAGSVAWVKKMLKRRGEVILVVPGSQDRIWIHTKQFYPDSVYRLPSGGIHEREAAEDAARRETREEMGFEPQLARFIGVVENVFKFEGETSVYPTYIFETKPFTGSPQVTDPGEAISGFQEIRIQDLYKVIEKLETLEVDWQPWGHFRSAPHALIAEELQGTV